MHIPVLQKEVLQYLDPKPNENFIDCTIGFGGHALAILEKTAPKGKLLGIDVDPEVIKNLKLKIKNFEERIVLVADNFANLKEIVKYTKFGPADGILFDLGMSSWHLEESGKGFTFLKDEPLDMRYQKEIQNSKFKIQNYLTAEKIVNEYSKEEIEKILSEYGEEKFARRITKKIVEERKIRPIRTTFQLVKILKKARIYQFKQAFQALRIAVNDELNNLEKALPQTIEVLERGGRIVVISFHSLEDRIVKNFFKNSKLKVLTKKPIIPSQEEIQFNPRSRSAKLRVAKKIC